MFVNTRPKATMIKHQRKAFYRQGIQRSSCARKEAVDIDILVTSRNGDKNPAIFQNNEQTSLEKKEMKPVEPVLKSICTCRKDLSWPHFDDEPRVREKQQVKDQQSCIFVLQPV